MDAIKGCQLIAISATLLVISATVVNGQISTPCTTSMISSFTPCFNYITGSTSNGSSPTPGCCSSLQSIMATSTNCGCLLIAANVPGQLPINRSLALSLPQACNMNGVQLQCKASGTPLPAPGSVIIGPTSAPTGASLNFAASGTPLPAPGSVILGPTSAPTGASPFSPRASKALARAPAPQSETTLPLTPASPPVEAKAPTTTPGIRPVLTPSVSTPSYVCPAYLLLVLVGITVFYI